MGIIVDVGHLPAVEWATLAAERWAPAPLATPRLISRPTAAPPLVAAPVRTAGEPSRMVAMARVLANWRAAEREVASLEGADPGRGSAEAAVAASCANYHRLYAEHLAAVDRR